MYPHLTSVVYEGRLLCLGTESSSAAAASPSFLTRRRSPAGTSVAAMLPKFHPQAMNELQHFAVPMADGVPNTLNTGLDAIALAFMLDHGGCQVLLVDPGVRRR